MQYTGYVYLWYDTRAKFFYVGGHYGRVEDNYVSSSRVMKRAYKQRPETFKFRVLAYTFGDTKCLCLEEQQWLDMIKPTELLLTENVYAKTARYYNVKVNAVGGNGKGTNKGKRHSPWNKGKSGIYSEETLKKMSLASKGKPKSPEHIAKLRIAHCKRKESSCPGSSTG